MCDELEAYVGIFCIMARLDIRRVCNYIDTEGDLICM